MKRGLRAWWLALVMVPAFSCLDFDAQERRFCDSGNGLVCGNTGINVTVQVSSSAVTTQCVKVFALAPGNVELSTYPIPLPPLVASVTAAVYQGSLPDEITLQARGYDDPGCTRLNEEGTPAAVRFAPGRLIQVTLVLNGSPCVRADAGTPCPGGVCRSDRLCADAGTEFDCVNGLDDDGDSRRDCVDPDCLSVACASSNQCLVAPVCLADGGCGGAPKACDTPPNFCYAIPGACSPATGQCSYAPDASIGCDDSDLCTTLDHCLLDGGCGGTAAVCNTPPGACFGPSTGCDPGRGCQYPVLTGNACSDGALCTFGDQCNPDGGCVGTAYSCPATECASARGCLGDGGCAVTVPKTGQPCTGGVCTDAGTCQTFPYPPSNFDPIAVAAGGIAGDISLSCNAWFDSTAGGRSWCSGQPQPVVTVAAQGGGPDVMVLAMTGLTITAGGSLTLVGSRPVILAVYGDATISGVLSARSGIGVDAGAGSGPASMCSSQNGNVTPSGGVGSGGGGGGYGTGGGNAGDLTGTGGTQGGNGGSSNGNASIIPLRGGCHGGEGGRPNDVVATGGQRGLGGGAVQVSAAGVLQVTGIVTASGAGGRGGREDVPSSSTEGGNGGGGGGSGGAVLLEGQDVFIATAARLTANGGGGGEGGDGNSGGSTGNPGADGQTTAGTAAAGGAGAVGCASDGASGASVVAGAGAAGNIVFTSGGCATGGGGGGVGRIRVNRSRTCKVDAGVMSPSPSFGLPCP